MVNKINRTFWKKRKKGELSFSSFLFFFFFPRPSSYRFLSSSRKIDRVNENIGISLLGNFVASSSCKTCLIDGSSGLGPEIMRQPIVRAGSDGTAPYRSRHYLPFRWLHFLSYGSPEGKTCLFFARSAIARGQFSSPRKFRPKVRKSLQRRQ